MIVQRVDRLMGFLATCFIAQWPEFPRASHGHSSCDVAALDARVDALARRADLRRMHILDAESVRPETEAPDGNDDVA